MLWLTFAALAAPPDPRAANAPDRLRSAAAADPDAGLDALVGFLVEGADDPAVRAARIHDWIALNVSYDLDSYVQGLHPRSDVGTTLNRRMAVCAGYAELFDAMAERAGLESVTVEGYGRGTAYHVFGEDVPGEANHAWNAVKLGDAWTLLDVTWDAGRVVDGTWERHFSRDLLGADPSLFATTHLPDDPSWQLLPTPLSAADLLARPALDGRFGADLVEREPLRAITETGATATFAVGRQPGIQVTARLVRADGTPVPYGATVDASGPDARIRLRFPEPGDYLVRLFTQRPDEEVAWSVATLGYRASEGTKGRMPLTYRAWAAEFALLTELPLADGPSELVLDLPGVSEASVVVGDERRPMVREGSRFSATVPASGWMVVVPAGPAQPAKRGFGLRARARHEWTAIVGLPTDGE